MSNNLTELLASIPVRDDSIRRALEDIEQKLSAWSAAVADFDPAPRNGGHAPAASPVENTAAHTNKPAARPVETMTAAARVDDTAAAPVADEPAPDAPASSGADDGIEYDVSDSEPHETPIARPASPDDDESVLVGLSPESAKAIKVQWRLLEGTKSLRQLVEEHKARLVRGDGSRDGKRSWWARGKG